MELEREYRPGVLPVIVQDGEVVRLNLMKVSIRFCGFILSGLRLSGMESRHWYSVFVYPLDFKLIRLNHFHLVFRCLREKHQKLCDHSQV